MFDQGVTEYKSDIVMGEKYRDEQTGIEGVVIALCFFQYACERATIEFLEKHDGKLAELTFDAPRLTRVSTGKKAETEKTGGPERTGSARPGSLSR